jgi:uncharacterized metal-binding protein YceD (DUF177 family)
MVKAGENVINEWSYFIKTSDVTDTPVRVSIEPDEAQKADLARRLDIETLESLHADLTVHPARGGVFHVEGEFRATVLQQCVVTLEPIHTEIKEPVEGWFSDEEQVLSFAKIKKEKQTRKAHAEVEILDESEDPEPIINGKIDLGELVTQHLSLAIDPYPHKEGVAYDFTDDQPESAKSTEIRRNPFEALKDWKEKR